VVCSVYMCVWCVCVCVCVCVVCMCVWCVYVFVCVYVCVCVVCVYMCVCVSMYVGVGVGVCVCVRNLIEEAGRSHYRPTPSMLGRPSGAAANVMRLDSRHNQHWPAKHKNNIHCCVCSERGQRRTTIYKCAKCDVGLCVVPCFADYHTKSNL